MPNSRDRVVVGICCIALLACAKNDPAAPATPTTYSGTYATAVSYVSNACTNTVIQDNPTTVTHNTTTGAIFLAHAGSTYTGTMASNHSFTTSPSNLSANGFTYVITLAGQFSSTTAFTADVTIDRTDASSATCRYVVHWIGSR